jgi:hypothetical protein
MYKINLTSVELIAVITSLEAVSHPSDSDLIKRLRALNDGPITLERSDHLTALINNETLEDTGLL